VIATRMGGIPELITAGETGLLVECGAPAQLRSAIVQLWKGQELQRRMGERARALVETKLSQTSRTTSLIDIYESLRNSHDGRTTGMLEISSGRSMIACNSPQS
jgi:glycosyltransferase involved in cell wall biosynthesis